MSNVFYYTDIIFFFLLYCFFRDQDKNVFVDPMRSLASAHLKQEPDRSRTPTNKELHRLYMESPHSKHH